MANNNYLLTYKDHFSNNIPRWNTIVKPFLLKKTGVVRVLDIEPVEGRSSIWILENIPNSHVTAISLNKKTLEHLQHNLKPFGDRTKIITASHLGSALRDLHEDSYDFIYIDSGKDARYSMEAAVTSFNLLKSKGMMVFDDYTTDHLHGQACPKPAIDHFADCYARYIKVIHATWQFVLLKRTKALPIKACRSEYYHENIDHI